MIWMVNFFIAYHQLPLLGRNSFYSDLISDTAVETAKNQIEREQSLRLFPEKKTNKKKSARPI